MLLDLFSCEDISRLQSTKPKYKDAEHRRYVYRLLDVLYRQDCKNVALAGSYGSGKSSILEKFISKARFRGHKVARVSLACFYPTNDSGISQQRDLTVGHRTDSYQPSFDQLEREILGQLLYQGEPNKMRSSLFNQAHRVSLRHRLLEFLARLFLSALFVVVVLYTIDDNPNKLAAWKNALMSALSLQGKINVYAAVAVIFLFSATLLICVRLVIGRLKVRSVTAPAVSLTLDNDRGGETYFNKYRDELIYLFEENRFDTVVFEDIDRFDDLRIFDELRNLNTILNLAPGVIGAWGKRSVHFVYAVKDGLFSSHEDEEASNEVTGSRRVKFFDMIVFVVPFISEFNAKEMINDTFKKEIESASNSKEANRFNTLLRMAAPYLADMRLLASIRNDYLVMVEEMGRPSFGRPSDLGLTCTGLLAISIFKNLLPSEFEDLRLGKGKLDKLYAIYRNSISLHLERLTAAKRLCSACKVEGDLSDDVCQLLGASLEKALSKRMESINYITIGDTRFTFGNSGGADIYRDDFWKAFFSLTPYDSIYLGEHRGYAGSPSFRFSKQELLHYLTFDGSGFAPAILMESGVEESGLTSLDEQIEHFRTADFSTMGNLECVVNDDNGHESVMPFSDVVALHFDNKLVVELINRGFICKDFYLYVSKYPAGAKPGAVYYVSHCYRNGQQDIDANLSAEDCAEILDTVPFSIFDRSYCLNYSLLRYLLGIEANREAAAKMIDGLVADYENSGQNLIHRLLSTYDAEDNRIKTFIALLMERTDLAIDCLVDGLSVVFDLHSQFKIMLEAFKNIDARSSYTSVYGSVWLKEHFEHMDIRSIDHGPDWASSMVGYLKECQIVVNDLFGVGPSLKAAVIDRGIYDINRDNLLIACGTQRLPKLDSLLEVYVPVGKKVLSAGLAFRRYLESLDEYESAITEFAPFVFEAVCDAADTWSDPIKAEFLAEELVTKINPIAPKIQMEDLCPVQELMELNDMGCAIFSRLIPHGFVERSPSNAVYLLKLEGLGCGFRFQGYFNRYVKNIWFNNEDDVCKLNLDDARLLAKAIISRDCMDEIQIYFALDALRAVGDELFPIDVESKTISNLLDGDAPVVSLYEHGFIQPVSIVYEALAKVDWKYRERLLKKWVETHTLDDIGELPHLFSYDLAPIIAASSSWGSWLSVAVRESLSRYLNDCLDECDKAKVEGEVKKVIEELGD